MWDELPLTLENSQIKELWQRSGSAPGGFQVGNSRLKFGLIHQFLLAPCHSYLQVTNCLFATPHAVSHASWSLVSPLSWKFRKPDALLFLTHSNSPAPLHPWVFCSSSYLQAISFPTHPSSFVSHQRSSHPSSLCNSKDSELCATLNIVCNVKHSTSIYQCMNGWCHWICVHLHDYQCINISMC